jgi:Circadian oscillating protein COP23
MYRMPPFVSKLSPIFAIGCLSLLGILWTDTSRAESFHPPTPKFYCDRIQGSPTTIVKNIRGRVPMIRWSKSFTGRYQSLNLRCREVSARLERFHRQGRLKFIRTGNVNSYPVLCVDREVSGNSCPPSAILLTLSRGTDGGLVLQKMLDLRARASGKPINLSGKQLVTYRNGDAYVNLELIINN